METTFMVSEAKLGSKRGTDATGTPTSQGKRGPRGEGLRPTQSGRAVKPRLRPVSLNPVGRYAEQKQENVIERNKTC